MVGRACRIGLLLVPLLGDTGVVANAAANGVSNGASCAVTDGVMTVENGDEAASRSLESPCFHHSGAEAWTCNTDGTTLTRTRAGETETARCTYGCVPLPDGFDSQCRPRDGELGTTVNGHAMTAQQASWVNYFAWCAVPLLPGARDVRLTAASTVTWWALKEGVLEPSESGPVGFSLCGHGRGRAISPLARCARGAPWQVGASGIQASCCTLGNVEGTAGALFPGMTESQLLSGAAVEAGYRDESAVHTGIVGSAGALRVSWLLRVTAIGFFYESPIVTAECITASRFWCYGRGWPATASYAPDKPSAMRSMSDLRAILDVLSP
jgi:hypothetical protein